MLNRNVTAFISIILMLSSYPAIAKKSPLRKYQQRRSTSALMGDSLVAQMQSVLEVGHKGKGGKGKSDNCTGKGKGKGKDSGKGYGNGSSTGKGKGYSNSLAPAPCPSETSSTEQPTSTPTMPPTKQTTKQPTPAPTIRPTVSIAPSTSQYPSMYDCASPAGRTRDIYSILHGNYEIGSPQAQAFDWILNIDDANACDGFTRLMERYILAVFYYSTEGSEWKNNSGWLTKVDHCTMWHGILCGVDGRVDVINLFENKLSGVIPSELAGLQTLSNIRLFRNMIQGNFPEEIYSLPTLSVLDLEENQIRGELFVPALQNATKLTKFRMSMNNFSGSIPSDIKALTALKNLWCASNSLTGTIPDEVSSLTALTSILLYDNDFSGSIPNDIGNLIDLQNIDLSQNDITGSIPSSFGNLVNIKVIILENMQLTGSIPASIQNFANLEKVLINDNDFVGPIPDLSNSSFLFDLVLARNSFSGSMPIIGPKLEFLDVRENSLEGSIPDEIFSLNRDTLEIAYFSNNTFSGTIPSSYSDCTALRDLWFDGNYLTGTIPDIQQGDLPSITEILFDENKLSGPVPDGICNLIESLPDQFISLHADCYPRLGTDVPNNPCDCCTDCSEGQNDR